MVASKRKDGSFSGRWVSVDLADEAAQIARQVVDISQRDLVIEMDRIIDDIGEVVATCSNVEQACEQIIGLS